MKTKYSFIANGSELLRRDFDEPPVELGWIPFTEVAKPTATENEVLVELAPTIANGVATQRFLVQSKVDAPPVRSTPAITEVPNWALEQELIERGLDGTVRTAIGAIANAEQRAKAVARFAKKPFIRRNDPLISALATALGWNVAFVDGLFAAAQAKSTS